MTSKSAKPTCALIAIAMLAGAIMPAAAQEIPNMTGTWKGSATAVFSGATPYRTPSKRGPNFGTDAVDISLIFKEQQGSYFIGESVSNVTEDLMGGFRPPDFKSGYIFDNDGEYSFTLRDPRTMDLCYRHFNATSKALACFTAVKQP